MIDYLKYILDLLIKNNKEEQVEINEQPCVQLEIQEDYIIFPEEKQEEDEEKESSVIIIDI